MQPLSALKLGDGGWGGDRGSCTALECLNKSTPTTCDARKSISGRLRPPVNGLKLFSQKVNFFVSFFFPRPQKQKAITRIKTGSRSSHDYV